MRNFTQQVKPLFIQTKPDPDLLQGRLLKEDDRPSLLLGSEKQARPPDSHDSPSSVAEVINSPGQLLDPATRSIMETSLGHDFSGVRIHRDDQAASSADKLGALAYTTGPDIVFGKNRYNPQQKGGAALLAHELTHVVQQSSARPMPPTLSAPGNALEQEADRIASQFVEGGKATQVKSIKGVAPFSIQRQTVSGTRSNIPLYELSDPASGSRQTLTGTSSTGNAVLQLSYDPSASLFLVTFPLTWIFPHAWTNSQRTNYVDEFQDAIERVWDDRFILNETVAPSRTAHVRIFFSSVVINQLASQAHEDAQLMGQTSGRWLMDVRTLNVREEVNRATSVVSLGATSNQAQRRNAATLRSMASYSISGTGGNNTFSQAASPHEFGHMIGLGDEYLEDVTGTSVPTASRGEINNRIMNVGENVTEDAYAPFVDWLSGLTSTRWRVGRRVR